MSKTRKKALLVLVLLMLAYGTLLAADQYLKICNSRTCYTQTVQNMKSWQWMKNADGTKFVRIFTSDGKIIDVTGQDLTVEVQKTRNK